MANLSLSPEELRARARELEKLRQQHLALMKKMRILVLGLSDSWKGEAQEAFEKNFLSRSRTMNELSSTMEKYIDLMETAADKTENVDQTLLRSINRLR